MTKYAIIVAGGSGSRMKSATPKQFLLLGDKPVLMHTIEAFAKADPSIIIVLVLPAAEVAKWKELVIHYNFKIDHQIQEGGQTRFHSVKNGLKAIGDEGLVAIHDGVRPLVTPDLIKRCYEAASTKSSGVAAVAPKDSIREVKSNSNTSVNRDDYQLIQTPQTFEVKQIKAAYQVEGQSYATDDATVAENYGMPITLVKGEYSNIKITTPEDIAIAQALINERIY
jgi:2-C-methyl-D-erythritol 4-phosphate cytidylyltransferase